MRPLAPATFLALALAPGLAVADMSMLGVVASGTVLRDQPLAKPMAHCLIGQGDEAQVIADLTADGFAASTNSAAGMTILSNRGEPYRVVLSENGMVCDVASTSIGTDAALMTLVVLAGMVGWEGLPGDCTAMRIAGAEVTLTASLRGAACDSASSSNLRFRFTAQ